jgi:hypothetical protein
VAERWRGGRILPEEPVGSPADEYARIEPHDMQVPPLCTCAVWYALQGMGLDTSVLVDPAGKGGSTGEP